MIKVGNVKYGMKCVHTFEMGRHKRQADITLLFQYTSKYCSRIIVGHIHANCFL